MAPIPPHTIHILLTYIIPPSELQTLPPHLISKPLRQRIHFLALTPEDPAGYLVWTNSHVEPTTDTSAHQKHVLHLLEDLPRPTDDDQTGYVVRYIVDAENTSAHVCIPGLRDGGSVRIVFLLEDGVWVYHNATTMPFPPSACASLREAQEGNSGEEPVRVRALDAHVKDFNTGQPEEEDDSYWDAYGEGDAEGDDDEGETLENAHPEPTTGGEDAYWAQYASVHGSGDSTQPSPLPHESRKLYHPPPFQSQSSTSGDTYNEPIHTFPVIGNLSHPHHTRGVPSPMSLTDRLNMISLQPSRPGSPVTSSSPLHQSWPSGHDRPASPLPRHSPLASSGSTSYDVARSTTSSVVSLGIKSDTGAVTAPVSVIDVGVDADTEEGNAALQESVRGLYRLWRRSHTHSGPSDLEKEQRELFFQVVRDAL